MKVKLAGSDYSNLVDHMEREHKYYKSDVDFSKIKDNIVLKPYVRDLKGYIKAQGVTRTRRDSVGAINCVCTVAQEDKEYLLTNPQEYERWGWSVIDSTLKTLNLTRGDILGAVIHLDEDKNGNVALGNAHLHFALAPLIREKNKTSLSAKRITTKQAFKALHDDLQKHMERQGFHGQYVNKDEESRGLGKLSMEEYKKAQDLNKEIKVLENTKKQLKENNRNLKLENEALMLENERFKAMERFLDSFKIKGMNALSYFNERWLKSQTKESQEKETR